MWIVKVLSFGMFVGLVLATIDADLEEDNFRTLKAGGNVGEEVETAKDDAETVDDEEASNDGGEVADDESKQFFETDTNPEDLPYMSLEEFDKLTHNKPFPTDFNAGPEDENEISRKKRNVDSKQKHFLNLLRPNKKRNKNKMDEKIRDTPEENSKFHGLHVLNEKE